MGKLYAYSRTLKKYIRQNEIKQEKFMKAEAEKNKLEGKKTGRLLEETAKVVKTVEHLDEDVSEITEFNKQFKTALVRPISYSFNEDFDIKYNINFDESIFAMGLERVYTLADFRTVIRRNGINFYDYRPDNINRDSAIKAFADLDPNRAADAKAFDSFVSG